MSQVIRVLLIEDNRIEARQTQNWLAAAKDGAFEVECVDQLKLGLERLAQGGIDVVLLDLNLPDSRGEATFEKLYAEVPEIPIVVLTGEFDEAIGPSTVAKGAQDYLVKQRSDSASLAHVLRYALARHRAQLDKIKESQLSKPGRVIGFLGAKGGVGTTTTALNVAVALAMQGKSVILAEMRPSFGTLTCHLRQQPARSLRPLLDLPPERIGHRELNAVLCEGPAGVWILFGPKEKEEEEFQGIDPLQAEAIIKGLSQLAEFVILDLPSQPSAATRAAAKLCHFAAVVTEREPSSVLSGKVAVKQLQTWGNQGNLASGVVLVGSIIVNRTIYSNSMGAVEIQSQMGCENVGVVPCGATENLRALTEGVPLVLLQPDSDIALSSIEIANRLSTDKVVGIHPGQGFALLKMPKLVKAG